jgi:dipeptidyl aminopeptidase/acylaminoacyl peptidase
MGMPVDNLEGCEASSALAYVENLQGKLLLMDGTSDDNVHIAKTMQLRYFSFWKQFSA